MCHSKTCCQTLKHFDNVIFTCSENVVEVFESLTSFWTMNTPLLSRYLGAFWRAITFNVILTITNAISKNLPSFSTKCLPVFLHYDLHSPFRLMQKTYPLQRTTKKNILSFHFREDLHHKTKIPHWPGHNFFLCWCPYWIFDPYKKFIKSEHIKIQNGKLLTFSLF